MKKSNLFLGILLALLLVLAVGCGDKETESTTDIKSVPAQEAEPAPAEITEGGTDVTAEVPAETVPPETVPEAAAEDAEAADAPVDVNETPAVNADNYRVISLKDLNVYPDDLTIKVGTTVEWRNINDNLQHIIGWNKQKSDWGVTPEPIKQGESWSYTFNKPGKITWFSTARPTIQGVITIEE